MKTSLFLILILLQLSCQSSKNDAEALLVDEETSLRTLSLFGKDVISTPIYERDLAISPKGDEFFYTLGDYKQNKRCIVTIKKLNGKWGTPEILSISGKYQDIEPFYSLRENRLFFASNRPIYNDESRSDYNIWYSDKINNAWSEPIPLDSTINSRGDEFFPSLSKIGNLFFTATRENGLGREDIFKSEFVKGQFQLPEPLPSEINSTQFEFNAFIDPNEDYIIFSSFGRNDGFGGGDLYISEKDKMGNWKMARNMGEQINSKKLDFCPFVDSTSGVFYFTSERVSNTDHRIHNIAELKQVANEIKNGFGNIYKIGVEALNLEGN